MWTERKMERTGKNGRKTLETHSPQTSRHTSKVFLSLFFVLLYFFVLFFFYLFVCFFLFFLFFFVFLFCFFFVLCLIILLIHFFQRIQIHFFATKRDSVGFSSPLS